MAPWTWMMSQVRATTPTVARAARATLQVERSTIMRGSLAGGAPVGWAGDSCMAFCRCCSSSRVRCRSSWARLPRMRKDSKADDWGSFFWVIR